MNAFAKCSSNSFSVPLSFSDYSDSYSTADQPFSAVDDASVRVTLRTLSELKPKITAGPDEIPAFLLRDCRHALAKPLSIIFNICLRTSTFPKLWKHSRVCPVYKKGEKCEVVNYRPVSIISNVSKTFELVLFNVVYNKVSALISPFQHGFIRGRSTTTNLFCMTQFIAEAFDSSSQVDVIYTDLTKAFDRLDHSLLLQKMRHFGFTDKNILLFSSYLRDRTQYVSYGAVESVEYAVTSGVPQGSVWVRCCLLYTLTI